MEADIQEDGKLETALGELFCALWSWRVDL